MTDQFKDSNEPLPAGSASSASHSKAGPPGTEQGQESATSSSLVSLYLILGQTLFSFGATAQRIQDSITYLARRLGSRVDMLVSYDALLITVNHGATFHTRIDSSPRFAGLNLLGLSRISAWLTGLPASLLSPEELAWTLRGIRDAPGAHSLAAQVLAAASAGAAFCFVNGGDPVSWLSSAIAAAIIFAIRRPLAALRFNPHLTLFAVAFAGCLVSVLLARVLKTTTPAIALVSPVLFLIPGVPMINGGLDIFRNHVTIGISRLGFTIASLVALSLGVGLAVPLLPSPKIPSPFAIAGPWEIVLLSIAGALAAGALACLNNGGTALISLCALGGLVGRLIRAVGTMGGLDLITSSLTGVLCSTLIVTFIADRFRWPSVVASVMAALPLVPGYFAIVGLQALLFFSASDAADPARLSQGLHALSRALFISVALVLGVIGPVILLQRDKERV